MNKNSTKEEKITDDTNVLVGVKDKKNEYVVRSAKAKDVNKCKEQGSEEKVKKCLKKVGEPASEQDKKEFIEQILDKK